MSTIGEDGHFICQKGFYYGDYLLFCPYDGNNVFSLIHTTTELFQIKIRISFTFLRAKHLRTYLLIMRTRIF